MIKNTVKLISTDNKEYFKMGISKDYLAIMSHKEIKKYSIETDKLMETKKIENRSYTRYIGTNKNNTLYFAATDSLLKTINLDNYEIQDYIKLPNIFQADFLDCSDGIWIFSNGWPFTYYFNLEKKEKIYKYYRKFTQINKIIKEKKTRSN